jgi:hypothetical protein
MNRIALAGLAALALPFAAAVAEEKKGAAAGPDAGIAGVAKPLAAADVATIDDARAFAAAEFKRADKNVDGKLEKAEFDTLFDLPAEATAPATIAAKPMLRQVGATDALFDGLAKEDAAISKEELTEARVSAFRSADRNVDAKLDAGERAEFAALVSGEPAPVSTN